MWIVLTTILTVTIETRCETFTIGYITGSQRKPGDLEYSRPGITISGAISLAVEEVNKGALLQTGHSLDFIIAETFGEEITSVRKTAELWTQNVSVYIGPQETCKHEAYMATAFNLPMISYFCTHPETSDKVNFPTFARTRPPDTQISKSVLSVLKTFNWTHVALLYLKSPDFEFGNIATTIVESLMSSGLNVIATRHWDIPYYQGYMENPFYELVDDTYQETRIYVIVGNYYEHLALMISMEEKGLFNNGEYFVVGVDIEQYDEDNPTKYLRDLLKHEMNPIAAKAYQSYVGIVPSSPVAFKNFTTLVNSYMERPPFNFPNPLNHIGLGKVIRAEAAYLYDAVHLYSKALIEVLNSDGNPRDGRAIIDSLKNINYKSAMGYMVYMDEKGDAGGNYTLIARKPLNDNADDFGLLPIGVFVLEGSNSSLPVLDIIHSIDWVSGKPPVAIPLCGFTGENCKTNTIEITFGITGGILFAVIICSSILYRNWKYEQELDSLLWKVDFRDVLLKGAINNNAIENKVIQPPYPYVRTSQVSLSSNADAEFRYSTVFTEIGIYKGRVAALKRVPKKCVDITREMKKELKMMRDLHHDNLNTFIGACTDPPNVCILTEYCTRGSLKDILDNEDVKLDSMFIASLVGDILRGMIYLHDSPVRFHGNLHTGNCLVDSRWVVKVTNFGLHEFRKGEENKSFKDPGKVMETCRKLLYRAPELVKSTDLYTMRSCLNGTPKGDVYSFGIILYELHGRQGPFGNIPLTYPEILHRIIYGSRSSIRPPLDILENTKGIVKECLKDCWAENPDDRPDFKSLRTKLRPLRKGMKPNIFDNMMAMMEKYANNLEVLVDERTDQLQEEKKKTDALLYEMLPKTVAEQLKRGNKVEAEGFECVTIYFSDIVGFTHMSAESTPLEVVDFLNDLYTCFDSIIGNYDVYKVETIGDAYMVVSGLPIRNSAQHAGEIATMSLHLLSRVKNFTIRHRPGETLLLRIGIHSGPVCAGVVGLKMPRYCLFGDTVNTASRMESTGLPLKIHCSRQCMQLLSSLGGYHLVERGEVSIKGKGSQQTYWLLSEDAAMRDIRKTERERRRNGAEPTKNQLVPKSSLKNKSGIIKSPISRCASFESPKKLRFACGANLNIKRNTLDVIIDSSPCKKSASSLTDGFPERSPNALKVSSTSCPCIENLTSSSILLAQSHLAMMFLKDDRSGGVSLVCRSVPSLCTNLNVPQNPSVQVNSAPVSPKSRKNHTNRYSNFKELLQWEDSTPLLKVTQADANLHV